MRILFGGDVMLGRLVKDAIHHYGPNYPLQPLMPMMREADVTIINLECAITSSTIHWQGEPKAFYFGAPSEAMTTLTNAGVDIVSLANNHILDFEKTGLQDTLHFLKNWVIQFAGAGNNEKEARAPAFFSHDDSKFGMIAYCDHQRDFAASDEQPGIAFLDLRDEANAIEQIQKDFSTLQAQQVDWPILSLHWGPNMVERPSPRFIRIAHAAIDMGYKIIFGHSAHIFQGIEIYKGYPIIYAAGDLVDDYYVDPDYKNDHQLLFEITISETKITHIHLHPVFIDHCQTSFANDEQRLFIANRMKKLCKEMGTLVNITGDKIWIDLT